MAGIPVNAFGTPYNRDVAHRFSRVNAKTRASYDVDATFNQRFGKAGYQGDNAQLFHIFMIERTVTAGITATGTPGQVIALSKHHQPVLKVVVLAFDQFFDRPGFNFRHLSTSSVLATHFKEGVS